MLIILPNIPRGAADTVNNINRVDNEDTRSTGFKGYLEDLSYIAKKYVKLLIYNTLNSHLLIVFISIYYVNNS